MPLASDQLMAPEPDVAAVAGAVGKLIGPLHSDGAVNRTWFVDPLADLEQIRDRFDVLVGVLPDLLGTPSTPPAPPQASWSWYPVPNPVPITPPGYA